jgi:hypothetical protein
LAFVSSDRVRMATRDDFHLAHLFVDPPLH